MLSNIYAVRFATFVALLTLSMVSSELANAQNRYDTGASDSEIKIGNIMPYSGPASAYGLIGKTEEAYFKMINDRGGINGRKIKFISYDDAYSPPRTVEQARRLVESDEVLLIFSPLGTPPNLAIHRYMNSKRVPHMFAGSGVSIFNDSTNFPWTMPWQLGYEAEGRIYAKYIIQKSPTARIGVIYQNEMFGNDLMRGLKDGLGSRVSSLIVAEERQESGEQLVEARILRLKSANADIFLNFLGPTHVNAAANAADRIGWKAQQIVTSAVADVLSPDVIARYTSDPAIELITARSFKSGDSQWQDDADYRTWSDFMAKYSPGVDKNDPKTVYGYTAAQALVHVLSKCGNNLTRENVMAQAASLRDVQIGMMLPGITLNTRQGDFAPIKQARMMKLGGGVWKAFGPIQSGDGCTLPKKQCGEKCCD